MHGQKLVHRDIKSQNVMISVNGDVKISTYSMRLAAVVLAIASNHRVCE